ncbi:MAG: thiamine phosphate synthase [Gemmatimonadales bacterium]
MAQNLAQTLGLLLVTDDALVAGRDLLAVCRVAVRGGVTCVELRLKDISARELVELARQLAAELPVPVLVNDRLDVALAAGAAGVHLGPDDLPVSLARRAAPPGFIIGASVGSPEEVEGGRGADYWGVGPWRATDTKADAGAAIGSDSFRGIVRSARGIPCVAIGGVRPEDIPDVLAAGGAGVAVVSGILADPDPEAAARRYRQQLDRLIRT